jgi:hypothetical protein
MALGVNIVSSFDSKGINKAISDFKKLDGAGSKATFGLRTLDKAATNGFKNVAKYGGLAAAGLGALALNFVKGAEFAKQADDRLAAVNKTMGLFGAQTAAVTKRLIEIGDKGEYQFGILAESIKDVQSKLLTFKEIAQEADVTGGLFDRATVAAIDLQAAGFGEATQNAVQLGKALNDPIKGITALARSGVTFTEQEKEKIRALVESGKMYEAQELLLKAIETQVGGTAAATTTATFKIGAAFGHVRDELGTLLLPLFEKFANFMVEKVVPYATKLAQVIGEDGIGAGLKMLAGTFLDVTTNMGAFGNAILALTAAFVTLRLVSIAATIAQNLFNVALFSNPIGIVVAAVIAFVVILAALYLKFEIVRKAVNMFGEVLKFVFINTVTAVQNYFIGFINIAIMGINVLIKAANFFGAGLDEVGLIGFKAFTGIGNAAKAAKAQISGVAETAGAFAAKEGGVREIAKALKAVGSAAGGEGGAGGGGAAKALETAGEKLQKYIDKLKGLSSAQKSARDADKSLMKSRTSLSEATLKLTDAQAYFNQVIAGYGANSKQAKDRQLALRKAQGAVEKAGYDVEGSVFAVTKAEQELADLRKDPTTSAQAIREAEIALAEAKLGVKDATESQVEATDALTEAETLLDETINGAKVGSDAYTEAVDKLNDAKKAQADAEDSVTEAIERQTEAVDRLREAEDKAREARTGVKAGAAATAEAEVGVTPPPATSSGGLFGSFMEAVRALHPNSKALKSSTPVTQARKDFPNLYDTYKKAGLAMAKGGIVTSPTQILAGEAGAEAIIPLDRLGGFGGQTINVTINAGIGTDASAVGDEIVNVLQRYNRRNGALPLKVA